MRRSNYGSTNTAVLFGHHDRHLKLIGGGTACDVRLEAEEVTVEDAWTVKQAERVLNELAAL